MSMKILLLIYLAGGILLNLVGTVTDDIKKEVRIQKYSQSDIQDYHKYQKEKRLLIGLEILLRLLVIIFSPVVLVIVIIDHYQQIHRQKKEKKQIGYEQEMKKKALIEGRSFLYFEKIHGGGIIKCHGCGYKEEIIGFVHGFGDPTPYSEGCQCQSCGAFSTIDHEDNQIVSSDKCSCGGLFSDKEPVFCPKCKSRDVSYQWTYVT